jgi:hypothetical protein
MNASSQLYSTQKMPMTWRSGSRMLILKSFMLAYWMGVTVFAQDPIRPNLDGFRYPALAHSAMIQGTVQFVVKSEGVQLLSGHPMLAAAAKSNVEKWATRYVSDGPLSATYIFRLRAGTGTQIVEAEEPIGNSFERFFLWLFHRPVTKRVKKEVCVHSEDSPPRFRNGTKDGLRTVEIDIEVAAFCLQTSTSYPSQTRQR